MSDDPTLGEVHRSVQRVEGDLSQARQELSRQDEKFVGKENYNQWKATVEAQIKELQDWKTWALRIVVGAVMLAMLGLVLANAAGSSTKSLSPVVGLHATPEKHNALSR